MISLKPKILDHNYYTKDEKEFVPNEFSIISWNVYKKNNKNEFYKYIQNKENDFYLFQEASFKTNEELIKNMSFQAGANIQFKNNNYGVLISSKVKYTFSKSFITEGKELFFGTHKSFIINKYIFKNKEELMIINIHSINFRGNKSFTKEINNIFQKIKDYKGSIIIAGDFNTWNKKRSKNLDKKIKELNLKKVLFEEKSKSFLNNELDFIFYRGLSLKSSYIDKKHNISDHDPLLATFKQLQSVFTI